MNINVRFYNHFSMEEIKAYAANPIETKDFTTDDNYYWTKHLELAALAEQYANGLKDLDEIYDAAERKMAQSIEDEFMPDGPIYSSYIDVMNNHISEAKNW